MPPITHEQALADTRLWLEKAVIGLNLCPFAKTVHASGQIRFRCSDATDTDALLADFVDEISQLHRTDPTEIDTTLLVHPYVLHNFFAYNDFLAVAEAAIAALGFEGTFQLASFHPGYLFAGANENDMANFTNRSPHPILQLLREDSVAAAVDTMADPDRIFENNIRRLRKLGRAGWQAIQRFDE